MALDFAEVDTGKLGPGAERGRRRGSIEAGRSGENFPPGRSLFGGRCVLGAEHLQDTGEA